MSQKAAIYDPYLDTLGGGERYCLTIAEILLKFGYDVDIFWSKDKGIIDKAAKRFSLNLDRINIRPDIFRLADQPISHEVAPTKIVSHSSNPSAISKMVDLFQRWRSTRHYDVIFYLSDGSIPILFSRKNFFHIQVPFSNPLSGFSKLKLRLFHACIFNSQFTQSFYPPSPRNTVLYPPVGVDSYRSNLPKNKTILSVGRFDNILNAKKQDVLVNAFKLFHQHQPDWQLILAGGSLAPEENNSFIQHLKQLSRSLPVKIIANPSFDQLVDLYQSSPIYWHAAGYQVDQQLHPEATEHFGITVVEAMAAGAVPLVPHRGGLPEIVTSDHDGFLWDTIDQLVAKTQLLVGSPQLLTELSQHAVTTSAKFSKSAFETKFSHLLNHDTPKN